MAHTEQEMKNWTHNDDNASFKMFNTRPKDVKKDAEIDVYSNITPRIDTIL